MRFVSCLGVTAISIAASLLMVPLVPAQSYPSKPVRFVVPFPPGGGTDTVARILGQKVSEAWGEQVIIDNRSGAQGTTGTAHVAKAAPDGYTLVLAYVGTMTIAPWFYKDLGYDPLRNFAHATQVSSQPLLIVVHPVVPARDMKELVALARSNPDRITYGTTGQFPQMAGELFKAATHTRMIHVPYKGSGPATADLLGGHIMLTFASPAGTWAQVKAGRLRALVVTGSTRLSTLPDVPTAREAGYPDLEMSGWYGVSVPAHTPREILAKINTEFSRAVALPQVKERFNQSGIDPVGNSSAEFTAYVKAEYERWGKIVKQSGIKVE